jgi:hypothetical protein
VEAWGGEEKGGSAELFAQEVEFLFVFVEAVEELGDVSDDTKIGVVALAEGFDLAEAEDGAFVEAPGVIVVSGLGGGDELGAGELEDEVGMDAGEFGGGGEVEEPGFA